MVWISVASDINIAELCMSTVEIHAALNRTVHISACPFRLRAVLPL